MRKNSCESCGMPFKKDPKGGGSNADGSMSTQYCSYCYQNGKFVHENVSVKEFQKICMNAMKKSGMSGFLAWIFTRPIPQLPRWKAKK